MSKDIRARINDEELANQIEEAAEEHGSISEAVRHAISHTYGDTDETTDEPETVVDRLNESSLRKAHRCLWSISRGRDGGRENVGHTSADAAMSVLAQEFSVNKAAVKPMYLTALKSESVIDVDPGQSQTIIYVVDPDAPIKQPKPVSNDLPDEPEPDSDDMDIDNQFAEIDEAEPVRAQTDDRKLTNDSEAEA